MASRTARSYATIVAAGSLSPLIIRLWNELGSDAPRRCRACQHTRESARRYPLTLLPFTALVPSRARRN